MELADLSLEDLLHASLTEVRAPLAPMDVCLCLSQVAEVLDFCNRRQHTLDGQRVSIQHCDVKPSNFLLCGDTVKLSDFGLASKLTSPWKLHRRAGTLDYAAPEVFQGQLTERTDQYALAVSYCRLRGGRLPFPDTPASFRHDYVRPEPDLTKLSPLERPLIARALAPFPQDRWPSCGELITRSHRRGELMQEPTLPATESPAPAETTAAGSPLPPLLWDHLLDLLAEQIERNAFVEARETVAALLRLEPADRDLLAARAFLEDQLARAAPAATGLCFRGHGKFRQQRGLFDRRAPRALRQRRGLPRRRLDQRARP